MQNKKKRVRVDNDIRAQLAYMSNHICCVCCMPNKQLQIHHLNNDPSCNDIDNLCLLCLECHNKTLVSGGFANRLSCTDIKFFRDRLYERNINIREAVDNKTIDAMLGVHEIGNEEALLYKIQENCTFEEHNPELSGFILSIPLRYKAFQQQAQPFYDKGSTLDIRHGQYIIIAGLNQIICELKKFYPDSHFDGGEYADEDMQRQVWDYAYKISSPLGFIESGSAVHIEAGMVMVDFLKFIINKLVGFLLPCTGSYVSEQWKTNNFS